MCIFFFVENYIHLPCLRAGRPYVIRTKMNHATQRTIKKVSQLARDDMFDAKNKRGPTWPYMVRQARPLHYDCGFPLLAGNLPPFHHPHFPPVPYRIPRSSPFCFSSKYIHIIHGTHVHPWGTAASECALQSICCGKSAWDSSDSFWAERKLESFTRTHYFL